MKFHKVKDAKSNVGHYSTAVESNNLLFISGQVPVNQITGEVIDGDFKTQFLQVLNNLRNVLNSSGLDIENVVKMNVYITDSTKWAEANEIYKEFFGEHKPARTILPVPPLHKGYLVEVDAVAEYK
ncbi:MAG: RidA family protein [Tissierellia bacterium]|nr:RidA family protein [Tissierellia bacterium]